MVTSPVTDGEECPLLLLVLQKVIVLAQRYRVIVVARCSAGRVTCLCDTPNENDTFLKEQSWLRGPKFLFPSPAYYLQAFSDFTATFQVVFLYLYMPSDFTAVQVLTVWYIRFK
jgi:hypothetical protein